MKATSNTQTIPNVTLLSLNDSPRASRFLSSTNTQLTTEPHGTLPTHQSPRYQSIKQSGFTGLAVKAVSSPDYKPLETEPSARKEGKPGDKFFQMIEEMRGVRKSSETKLKQMKEDITRYDNEAPEKMDWKRLVETGQYIGTRKQGQEKKDAWVSSRELSKERELKEFRNKISTFKYDLQNKKNVIKHLTMRETPNPESLVQPLYTCMDTKSTVLVKKESAPMISSARTPPTNIEGIRQELAALHFDILNSPHVRENDFMLSYNQEQLKKLKGGLTYLNTWKSKHKPKTSMSYRREKSRDPEEEEIVTPKGKEKKEIEREETLEDRIRNVHEAPPKPEEIEVFHKRSPTKKQTIEERALHLDPHGEFLKKIGLSPRNERKSPTQGLFMTTYEARVFMKTPENPGEEMLNDKHGHHRTPSGAEGNELNESYSQERYKKFLLKMGIVKKTGNNAYSQRILTASQEVKKSIEMILAPPGDEKADGEILSAGSPRLGEMESDGMQSPNGFFVPRNFKRMSPTVVTSNDPSFMETFKTSPENTFVRKDVKQFTGFSFKSVPMTRKSIKSNVSLSPKKKTWIVKSSTSARNIFSMDPKPTEKEELLKKYAQISTDCSENVRSSVEIKSAINKDFGIIKGQLAKVGEVKTTDKEIENRIKQDIYAEIQHSSMVAAQTANTGKKVSQKSRTNESKKQNGDMNK